MQLKNNREIQAGDYLIGPVEGTIVAGKVHEFTGKLIILYPVQGRTIFAEINPKEFLHVNDAMEAADIVPMLRSQVKELTERSHKLAGEVAELGTKIIAMPRQAETVIDVEATSAAAAWGGAVPVPIKVEPPAVVTPPGIFPNVSGNAS